eukprot:g17905.t1
MIVILKCAQNLQQPVQRFEAGGLASVPLCRATPPGPAALTALLGLLECDISNICRKCRPCQLSRSRKVAQEGSRLRKKLGALAPVCFDLEQLLPPCFFSTSLLPNAGCACAGQAEAKKAEEEAKKVVAAAQTASTTFEMVTQAGRTETLKSLTDRIKKELGLDASLNITEAIREAQTQLGMDVSGTLMDQAKALLAAIGC